MTIPIDKWTERAKKHAICVSPYTDAFLKRRDVRKTHPVHDFLFTYYRLSPQKLKEWVPCFFETLEFTEGFPWLNDYWFKVEDNILSHKPLPANFREIAKFILELCQNILERTPKFGCFGLHEWAMVYKTKDIRHQSYPLRLSPDEISRFVESQTICCSHYDAYRFFTEESKPLNILNPTLDTRLQMEQGGCIHANMDLYKWASKLWPSIGSDFLAKAFFLALDGREIDMRASPYDLSEHGYTPICVETEEGRKRYQKEQQLYAKRSCLLREELRAFCERLCYTEKSQEMPNGLLFRETCRSKNREIDR